MTTPADPPGLDAFVRRVIQDSMLVSRLRPILDRDAFIAAALEVARERGFRVERVDIEVAMREGQRIWLGGALDD